MISVFFITLHFIYVINNKIKFYSIFVPIILFNMVFDRIEINNFRGIRHMVLDNVKQINLLVGKNNCGKSSILDAIFLLSGFSNPLLNLRINQFRDYNKFDEEDLILNFYNMIPDNHIHIHGRMTNGTFRDLKITPIISESQYVVSKDNISSQSLSNKEANISTGLTMNFSYTKDSGEKKSDSSAIIITNQQSDKIKIRSSKDYNETLSGVYINSKFAFSIAVDNLMNIIQEKQEHVIVEILKQIDPKIKSISVLKSGVNVDIGLSRLVPINMLGDGIRKMLAIITSLYGCKGGVIFIDEIDNGLHFSSLSSLWKAIIKTSELLNVQVFATTHNIESLQSLNKVLYHDYVKSREKIMCYSLRHMVTDELNAYEYPYDKFNYVINQEIEIR